MKYLILCLILIILIFILKTFEEKFEEEHGTYKNTPYNFNSRNIIDSKDFGVLMNLRPEKDLNTFSQDLNFNEMNVLINYLKDREFTFKTFENISNDIVDRINKQYDDLKPLDELQLFDELHHNDKRKYELIEYDILKTERISKFTNSAIINIKFFKKMKDITYTIQFKIFYGTQYNIYVIKTMNIIGIQMNENVLFKNLKDNEKYCSFTKGKETNLQQCHKEELKIDFFKQKKEESERDIDYRKYKCVGKDGFNESTCSSYSFKKGIAGTWDKPCIKNDDCPFFKKNKNYPNQRGGCIKGNCELPVNLERLGFKKYNTKTKPFCYNCNMKNCSGTDCYTCCSEQKNKKKYPYLNSPDYMFGNDKTERNRFLIK